MFLSFRASKPIVTPEVIRQEEEARQAANSAAATKGLSGKCKFSNYKLYFINISTIL